MIALAYKDDKRQASAILIYSMASMTLGDSHSNNYAFYFSHYLTSVYLSVKSHYSIYLYDPRANVGRTLVETVLLLEVFATLIGQLLVWTMIVVEVVEILFVHGYCGVFHTARSVLPWGALQREIKPQRMSTLPYVLQKEQN